MGAQISGYLLQVSLTIFRLVTPRSAYSSLLDALTTSFSFLFCFLLCLGLMGARTSHGHGVAEMIIQFNAGAVEFPCLTVARNNGKLARARRPFADNQ